MGWRGRHVELDGQLWMDLQWLRFPSLRRGDLLLLLTFHLLILPEGDSFVHGGVEVDGFGSLPEEVLALVDIEVDEAAAQVHGVIWLEGCLGWTHQLLRGGLGSGLILMYCAHI